MLFSNILRLSLLADAGSSGLLGLFCMAGAGPLSAILGLPEGLLRAAGLILLPWAVLVGLLARSEAPRPIFVWTVVAVNVLWVIDSLALLVAGDVSPTALGTAFVIVQAVAVAALASLQIAGLRQSRAWQPSVV